jgi:uncharacterized protein
MSSRFIWYELVARDPGAAAAFYGAVVGWTTASAGMGGMDYQIFSTDGVGIGGLMPLADAGDMGAGPGWLGYVSVADVDASVARIVAAGGKLLSPAMDVPSVGRMAMVADPQGARLHVMAPIGESSTTASGGPGYGGWHELHTTDWKSALDFYHDQFGWQKVEAMDMGPAGIYLMFNFGSGEMAGGMFNEPGLTSPYWLYYFNVDDIDAAVGRVKANGGTAGPAHEVPGGTWVSQASDPEGAMFALSGPKR